MHFVLVTNLNTINVSIIVPKHKMEMGLNFITYEKNFGRLGIYNILQNN